jgi:glycerophosphoryl diester phosphodiesterase
VTLRIGHRGAAAVAPENTIASFRRAVELGAQAVELDVQRTKDGHLVVMHDDTVDRTTDGTGHVAELTLARIRRLDAGSWNGTAFAGERVPTLDELGDALRPEILLFVEIKGTADQGTLRPQRVLRSPHASHVGDTVQWGPPRTQAPGRVERLEAGRAVQAQAATSSERPCESGRCHGEGS